MTKFHELVNRLIDASPDFDDLCALIDMAFANEQITPEENTILYKLIDRLDAPRGTQA